MENEQLKQKAKEYAEENYQQFWDVENINELYKAFLAGALFVSQNRDEEITELIRAAWDEGWESRNKSCGLSKANILKLKYDRWHTYKQTKA